MVSAIEAIEGAGRTTVAALEALKSDVMPSVSRSLTVAESMANDRRLSASVRGRAADIRAVNQDALAVLQAFVAPAQPSTEILEAGEVFELAYVATVPAEVMPCFRAVGPELESETDSEAEFEAANGEDWDEASEAEPIFVERVPAHTLQSLDGLRVLVGEANGVHQLMLRTILAQFGAEPEFHADGIELMQAWREGGWDLVLLDTHMPRMDGFAAAQMIRSVEHRFGWSSTPIVALTPDAAPQLFADCAEAGMSAWVAKPIAGGALFDAIEDAFATPDAAPMIEDLPVQMARVA
jgi:CheY-like chemotaxis protein